MVWINRPTATGKKSYLMWYFVERRQFRFLRKKKVFDVKSAKKEFHL